MRAPATPECFRPERCRALAPAVPVDAEPVLPEECPEREAADAHVGRERRPDLEYCGLTQLSISEPQTRSADPVSTDFSSAAQISTALTASSTVTTDGGLPARMDSMKCVNSPM